MKSPIAPALNHSFRAFLSNGSPRRENGSMIRSWDVARHRWSVLCWAEFPPLGCDVNPLSVVLTRPRLTPPFVDEIAQRLRQIDFFDGEKAPEDLLVFYHPKTLQQITALK